MSNHLDRLLRRAADNGDVAEIERLCALGADPSAKDRRGKHAGYILFCRVPHHPQDVMLKGLAAMLKTGKLDHIFDPDTRRQYIQIAESLQ